MNRQGKGASREREESHTLAILEAIEREKAVTQRRLAKRLGVALGLTNSYLKRCVRKGLIKIRYGPANRYLYYLTPKGFAEKSRLTAQYLAYSFEFYRHAGDSMSDAFAYCAERAWTRALLAGVSELAEIGFLRAQEFPIEIIGTYDPTSRVRSFLGRPVWRRIQNAHRADACIFTALELQDGLSETVSRSFDSERFVVPGIVRSLVMTDSRVT